MVSPSIARKTASIPFTITSYNRHNDNVAEINLGHQDGRYEFATVRNNVYKLSVNKITESSAIPAIPTMTPIRRSGDPDESLQDLLQG